MACIAAQSNAICLLQLEGLEQLQVEALRQLSQAPQIFSPPSPPPAPCACTQNGLSG
jgi:hypothetical protein